MSKIYLVDRLEILVNELASGNKAEFARLIDENPSQVNKWLNSGQAVSNKALINIARHGKVNLNWLLTGEGERFIKQEPAENSEETVKDLTPAEIKELIANLNQLPAIARDALITQAKTLAEAFDKSYKESTEVDESE